MIKTIVCFLTLIISYSALSACNTPAGARGVMVYRNGDYFYCNNVDSWVRMKADPNAPGATCSTPGLIVGESFCNGANFYSVNSQETNGACAKNSEYRYISGIINVCISGTWYKTGTCESCRVSCESYLNNRTACDVDYRCHWNGGMCETIPTHTPPPGPPAD